ncbi:MAG: D-alanyl-D-alanine carboxypeptidase family protein [Dehalococcoidia bacterium]
MPAYVSRLRARFLPPPMPAGVPATLLLLVVIPLLAACNGRVSATEVRANGSAIGASGASSGVPGSAPAVAVPAARKTSPIVPPPSGTPPKQPLPVPAPAIAARAAVVIDDATGAVLYDYNGRTRVPPASLTKIATAALAIDRGKLDDWVTVDYDFTDPTLNDATEMGLERGDRFRLRDLIYGMLLPSGADASIAIAHAISGSEEAFVRDMNTFMESLGLYDTHFIDPHGVGGAAHVSTAYDLAMLSRYAMRQPLFADAVRAEAYRATGSRTIEVYNTNPWAFGYPGGDGVKSGYTEEAGPTLSASATRNGHRVIVVVLNSARRNQDTTALMDWAFQTFCWSDGSPGCSPGSQAIPRSTPAR